MSLRGTECVGIKSFVRQLAYDNSRDYPIDLQLALTDVFENVCSANRELAKPSLE